MLKILKNLFSADDQPAQADDNGLLINAYISLAQPPELTFPHELMGLRDLSDPELDSHLDGFVGYVQSRGDGSMTRIRYHLFRHIQKVRHQLSVVVQPQDLPQFYAWAARANAILFMPDGAIRDPAGHLLLGADGSAEETQAHIPHPAEAWDRKEHSDHLLATRGIHVAATLPPVIGATEVDLRSAQEVATRLLGLFTVALRAEFLADGEDLPLADIETRLPLGLAAATPRELEFLHDAAPAPEDLAQFGWRYECVNLLAWAIGALDTLPFPDAICDVGTLAGLVLDADAAQFVAGAKLRPAAELIDALDLHYRLHWAARQADVDGKDAPDGFDAGVVLERHYALNWLVRFEGADWDDIDTPT